jgi:hypothetical protein
MTYHTPHRAALRQEISSRRVVKPSPLLSLPKTRPVPVQVIINAQDNLPVKLKVPNMTYHTPHRAALLQEISSPLRNLTYYFVPDNSARRQLPVHQMFFLQLHSKWIATYCPTDFLSSCFSSFAFWMSLFKRAMMTVMSRESCPIIMTKAQIVPSFITHAFHSQTFVLPTMVYLHRHQHLQWMRIAFVLVAFSSVACILITLKSLIFKMIGRTRTRSNVVPRNGEPLRSSLAPFVRSNGMLRINVAPAAGSPSEGFEAFLIRWGSSCPSKETFQGSRRPANQGRQK